MARLNLPARVAVAFVLAAVAVLFSSPARAQGKWIGPTNCAVHPDVNVEPLVINGKLYVILWRAKGDLWLNFWEDYSRVWIGLREVALHAYDSRPCAHGWPSISYLVGMDQAIPDPRKAIRPDGSMWLLTPENTYLMRLYERQHQAIYYYSYQGHYTFTPCKPAGSPDLTAMLCEVVVL